MGLGGEKKKTWPSNAVASARLNQVTTHLTASPPASDTLGPQVSRLIAENRPDEAAQIALNAFLSPPRYKTNSRQQEVLESAEISHLEVDGNAVVVYTWNAHRLDTILLTHGFSTSAAFLAPLISYLVAETPYRIVAIDQVAHGAASGTVASVGAFVRTLTRLLTDNQSTPLRAIVGHSVGATAVVMTLATQAERNPAIQTAATVPKIVLVAPPLQPTTLMVQFCKGHSIPLSLVRGMEKAMIPNPNAVLKERLGAKISPHIKALVVQDESDVVALPKETDQLVDDLRQANINVVYEKTQRRLGHFKVAADKKVFHLIKEFIE